ncbi:hypothetical protein [Aquidulcibacter sp.]|uniref:hypothetical protein n=1 Tax=Aquidulcibacter sp. TaxID=2052990 RepID=UPI0025C59F70|nr:hypothetical protein [Aquidulcibacter sp.]MCA3696975.1 hypothetical protein [Aquidulcibacter sp.]
MNIETKNISLTQTAPSAPIRPGQEAVVVQPASKNIRNQQTDDRAPSNDYKRPVGQESKSAPVESVQDELDAEQRVAMVEKIMGTNKSLVIEKNKDSQGFIYKSVDRVTGEVTRIWPIEDLANTLTSLADEEERATMRGVMIDAKA